MDKGNDEAFHQLAGYYAAGTNGMPQNWIKANELYLKAGELGDVLGDITTWVIPIMKVGVWNAI